jgi:DNA polymerase-3 subunit delta'
MIAFAPWQQRAYDQAVAALGSGRLGHGLLVCGPARLGKRMVVERLAQLVLCREPAAGEPCGQCRDCTLFLARSQSDPVEIRPDGSLAHPWGHPGHPDATFLGFGNNEKTRKPRTEVVIEQIRNLSEWFSLTPQYGRAQVAILDPADAINNAACNALLKTLEEPHPGRYLWLLSANPARLPATIRSRCQRLEFRLPPHDEARAWLRACGHADADADEALDAARGHPGLADAWLRGDGMALRREVAADLRKLECGEAGAISIAQAWVADEYAATRLRHAADIALAMAAGDLTGSDLTMPARTRRLAAWFDQANRARDLLRTTVRVDLIVIELLLAWQDDARRQAKQGGRG